MIEFADDVLIMSSSSVVNEHSGIISLLIFPTKHVPLLYSNIMKLGISETESAHKRSRSAQRRSRSAHRRNRSAPRSSKSS